ncbi:class I SAM-dependent methyltransferase [Methanolacinia paynteri]|uniref:class I SAM-dependent methyltransferase n=1 Tax=Methanolacinia paynteri TaxID=230356 RepID=UPI00064F5C53|nr:class I SAM-dependent methyltransferase [Methanolacinia paynteri]
MTGSFSGWEKHYRKHRQPWAGTVPDRPVIPEGSVVLEAGCGNGKFLKELLKDNIKICAFDFSEKAVDTCKKDISCCNTGRRADLLTADCTDLPFRDSAFDTAFYRHVTGHLDETGRKKSAGECTRVLKDGGLLYFTGFSVEDMRAGNGVETEQNSFLRGNGILTHYFTEEEVRRLFPGLDEISVKTIRWNMRVRGTDHARAEINAVFRKSRR